MVFSSVLFLGRSERFKRGDGIFGQRNGSLRIPPLVRLGKKDKQRYMALLLTSNVPEDIIGLIVQIAFNHAIPFNLNQFLGSKRSIIDCRTVLGLHDIPLVFPIPLQPSPSISLADIKVSIDISHPHALVVGYDTHETLANVADLVVVV